jgi:hypothetical protein
MAINSNAKILESAKDPAARDGHEQDDVAVLIWAAGAKGVSGCQQQERL